MTTVLIFDGQSGFCTRTVRWLLRLDRRGLVVALPYQSERAMATYELSAAESSIQLPGRTRRPVLR